MGDDRVCDLGRFGGITMNGEPGQMSEQARKALNDDLELRHDFRGECVKCGLELVGSLAQMRSHECKEEPEGDEEGQ